MRLPEEEKRFFSISLVCFEAKYRALLRLETPKFCSSQPSCSLLRAAPLGNWHFENLSTAFDSRNVRPRVSKRKNVEINHFNWVWKLYTESHRITCRQISKCNVQCSIPFSSQLGQTNGERCKSSLFALPNSLGELVLRFTASQLLLQSRTDNQSRSSVSTKGIFRRHCSHICQKRMQSRICWSIIIDNLPLWRRTKDLIPVQLEIFGPLVKFDVWRSSSLDLGMSQ